MLLLWIFRPFAMHFCHIKYKSTLLFSLAQNNLSYLYLGTWYLSILASVHPGLCLWSQRISCLGNSTKLGAGVRDWGPQCSVIRVAILDRALPLKYWNKSIVTSCYIQHTGVLSKPCSTLTLRGRDISGLWNFLWHNSQSSSRHWQ